MRSVAVTGALMLSLAGSVDAAAKTAAGEAAVPRCDRVVVFRYDVTVTGAKSGREVYTPESSLTGEFRFSYSYSAHYPAVRVVVDRGCDPEIDTVRVRARGSTTLVDYFQADHAVPKEQEDSVELPCDFQAAAADFGSRLRVAGGTTVLGGGPSTFTILSDLPHSQLDKLIALLDARRDAACDKGAPSNLPVLDELPAHGPVPIFENRYRVGGVELDPPNGGLGGALRGGGRRGPRSLTRLVAGRSFQVASGVRRYEGTRNQAEATASTSITIRFDRRR